MDRTYQQVLGQNIRRLRDLRGIRQEDLARLMLPAKWTQTTVSEVEAGRRSVSLGEALLLQGVLGVAMTELVQADDSEKVDLCGLAVTGGILRSIVVGSPPPEMRVPRRLRVAMGGTELVAQSGMEPVEVGDYLARAERLGAIDDQHGDSALTQLLNMRLDERRDAEAKTARRLKVEPFDVVAASYGLWGRTLTEQRDERRDAADATGDARAAVGWITRRLTRELEEHLVERGVLERS